MLNLVKTKMKLLLSFLICCLPLFSSLAEEGLTDEYAKSYREEGYKLQSEGNYEGALSCYHKAIQLDPVYVEVYNDLGIVYENMGNDESALEMYKKALEIEPNYLPACTNIAFFYEKKRDIRNARVYWEKRRDLSKEKDDDHWRQVAIQHIDNLLVYPEFRQERVKRDAGELSKTLADKLAYQREQARLKLIDEAKLRFDIGSKLFLEEEYSEAIKELETVFSLNLPDEEFKGKVVSLLKQAKRLQSKRQAVMTTEEALNYIKTEDFLTAAQKLKNALSEVARISPEK